MRVYGRQRRKRWNGTKKGVREKRTREGFQEKCADEDGLAEKGSLEHLLGPQWPRLEPLGCSCPGRAVRCAGASVPPRVHREG